MIRSSQKIKLYVNGIFDNSNSTNGWTNVNSSPLYLGNTPVKMQECPVPFLMDELRYYNYEIPETEIFSEAGNAFGQIEPRFIQLGCVECSLDDANKSCNDGYHLCTTIELHSGGYDAIRANGWYKISAQVWSYSALDDDYDKSTLGLGVCCLDLVY